VSTTYTNLLYHVVFATKYRKPKITDSIKPRLYEYMGGIIRGQRGIVLEIGGVQDHVHLLCKLSPSLAVSDVLRFVKGSSSKWMNETFPSWNLKFAWQTGFAAFTVSHSQASSVRRYVASQEEHHRKMSFTEEYIAILRKHEIAFETKYLFEQEHVG